MTNTDVNKQQKITQREIEPSKRVKVGWVLKGRLGRRF
jgi:hypothetical protein